MSLLINTSEAFVYQAETNSHNTRVIADGGTIDNLRDIDNDNNILYDLGLSGNRLIGFGAASYKNTGALIDKTYDLSGNNKDLTGVTTTRPSFNATGRMNKSCFDFSGSFNNTASRLSTAAYSFPNNNNQLTIIGWFKMGAIAGYGSVQTIFRTGTTSGASGLWIYKNNSLQQYIIRYIGTAGADLNVSVNLAGATTFDGIWQHLAFTIDYTTRAVLIYRNGLLVATLSMAVGAVYPSINDVKEFGYHTTLNQYSFNGSMDKCNVFDKVLTASQIGRIMNEI